MAYWATHSACLGILDMAAGTAVEGTEATRVVAAGCTGLVVAGRSYLGLEGQREIVGSLLPEG